LFSAGTLKAGIISQP